MNSLQQPIRDVSQWAFSRSVCQGIPAL